MSEGAIVLVSGGIDSATALALACEKDKMDPITVLHYDYGQPTMEQEHICAEQLAADFGDLDYLRMDIQNVFQHSMGGILDSSAPLDTQHLDEEGRATSYVPQRNIVLLSIAASIAEYRGLNHLYYSPNLNDAAYPDCLKPFADATALAFTLGSGKIEFEVHRPLIDMEKSDIINLGSILEVDWSHTWSCYTNDPTRGEKACGKCASCVERIEGFKKYEFMESGVVTGSNEISADPIAYEN